MKENGWFCASTLQMLSLSFPRKKWNQLKTAHSAVAHNRVHDVQTSASQELNDVHVCFVGTIKNEHVAVWLCKIQNIMKLFALWCEVTKKNPVAYKRCNRILDVFWAMQTSSCGCQLMMENASKVSG